MDDDVITPILQNIIEQHGTRSVDVRNALATHLHTSHRQANKVLTRLVSNKLLWRVTHGDVMYYSLNGELTLNSVVQDQGPQPPQSP
jgi:hypothetical protein